MRPLGRVGMRPGGRVRVRFPFGLRVTWPWVAGLGALASVALCFARWLWIPRGSAGLAGLATVGALTLVVVHDDSPLTSVRLVATRQMGPLMTVRPGFPAPRAPSPWPEGPSGSHEAFAWPAFPEVCWASCALGLPFRVVAGPEVVFEWLPCSGVGGLGAWGLGGSGVVPVGWGPRFIEGVLVESRFLVDSSVVVWSGSGPDAPPWTPGGLCWPPAIPQPPAGPRVTERSTHCLAQLVGGFALRCSSPPSWGLGSTTWSRPLTNDRGSALRSPNYLNNARIKRCLRCQRSRSCSRRRSSGHKSV